MYDAELKYCPACRDEYRAEIVRCAVCEIELLTGDQMQALDEGNQQKRQNRAGALTPEDEIVTIHKAPLADIKRLEGLLREERIAAVIVGDEQSCGKSCCPTNFYLQVRRQDALDALQVVEGDHARHTALHHHDYRHGDGVFNADAGEASCPACGHRFPTAFSTCPECGLCFG